MIKELMKFYFGRYTIKSTKNGIIKEFICSTENFNKFINLINKLNNYQILVVKSTKTVITHEITIQDGNESETFIIKEFVV